MLVELGLVEQRVAAVLEVVNEGVAVAEVARRYGVTRQTVHRWLRRFAAEGMRGLADRSSKPLGCPHQMSAEVEALIVEMRRACPGWGPQTLLFRLQDQGVEPLPSRSAVYRCLVRHNLVTVKGRRRKKSDYKRWERARAMELWQMDIVGGVRLADGSKASIVSGIDDHSRFVVSARVVARATARPVADALARAMRAHGVPGQILTDNGKVFTNRFGPGTGEVLFDKVCRQNGIKHILTKPRSPTTTGKVERWHKTLRREFLNGKVFDSIPQAQLAVDVWVEEYNHARRHQGIGGVVPWQRFRLAEPAPALVDDRPFETRRVSRQGQISVGGEAYGVGAWLAGETVQVFTEDGVLSVEHRGAVIVTHAQRRRISTTVEDPAAKPLRQRPRQATVGQTVTRKVDSSGNVSFAGTTYRVGNRHRRRQVQVAIIEDAVEISAGGEVLRVHKIRHDRSREHGAFANAGGRPSRSNAA